MLANMFSLCVIHPVYIDPHVNIMHFVGFPSSESFWMKTESPSGACVMVWCFHYPWFICYTSMCSFILVPSQSMLGIYDHIHKFDYFSSYLAIALLFIFHLSSSRSNSPHILFMITAFLSFSFPVICNPQLIKVILSHFVLDLVASHTKAEWCT